MEQESVTANNSAGFMHDFQNGIASETELKEHNGSFLDMMHELVKVWEVKLYRKHWRQAKRIKAHRNATDEVECL